MFVSLWLLRLPPKVQIHAVSGVRLLGDSKLPVGLNVSASGCRSLCVIHRCNLQGVHYSA